MSDNREREKRVRLRREGNRILFGDLTLDVKNQSDQFFVKRLFPDKMGR